MKCWNCKKKGITKATRVPVLLIGRNEEKFRDFCDDCYQVVRELRRSGRYPPLKAETQ